MMTINTIIIDDEIEAQSILSKLLEPYNEINIIAKASSVEEALIKILEYNPELIFLDIEMPNKNGFELVELLNKNNISVSIIFVTAFNQFAIDAFKVSAFDYLLKPVDILELKKSIVRYKSLKANEIPNNYNKLLDEVNFTNKIRFNTRTGFVLINKSSISHCIADNNYTVIYHSDNKNEIVSQTLGNVEKLLNDKTFYRIGRSCIINLTFLDKIDRKLKKCIIGTKKEQYHINIPIKYIKRIENIL